MNEQLKKALVASALSAALSAAAAVPAMAKVVRTPTNVDVCGIDIASELDRSQLRRALASATGNEEPTQALVKPGGYC